MKLKTIYLFLFTQLFLTGCSSYILSPKEYEDFQPIPSQKRVSNNPTVKWIVLDDAAPYCSRISGIPIYNHMAPIACATWSNNVCTIYTSKQTSHLVLGHELRHCFEGSFH